MPRMLRPAIARGRFRRLTSSRPGAAFAAPNAKYFSQWLVRIRPSRGGFVRSLHQADVVMGKWNCNRPACTTQLTVPNS